MCKVLEDMRNESFQEGIRIGRQEVFQEAFQEGFQEARRENMLATAKKMLSLGKYALDEIAQITGLSLDEVKTLQASQNI